MPRQLRSVLPLREPVPGFMHARLSHRGRVVLLNLDARVLLRRTLVMHGSAVRGANRGKLVGSFRPRPTHTSRVHPSERTCAVDAPIETPMANLYCGERQLHGPTNQRMVVTVLSGGGRESLSCPS